MSQIYSSNNLFLSFTLLFSCVRSCTRKTMQGQKQIPTGINLALIFIDIFENSELKYAWKKKFLQPQKVQ